MTAEGKRRLRKAAGPLRRRLLVLLAQSRWSRLRFRSPAHLDAVAEAIGVTSETLRAARELAFGGRPPPALNPRLSGYLDVPLSPEMHDVLTTYLDVRGWAVNAFLRTVVHHYLLADEEPSYLIPPALREKHPNRPLDAAHAVASVIHERAYAALKRRAAAQGVPVAELARAILIDVLTNRMPAPERMLAPYECEEAIPRYLVPKARLTKPVAA